MALSITIEQAIAFVEWLNEDTLLDAAVYYVSSYYLHLQRSPNGTQRLRTVRAVCMAIMEHTPMITIDGEMLQLYINHMRNTAP